ncbi:MAG: hypothetical protein AMXMBFR7_16320 [Planctomycetota bacterium]
MKPSLPKDMPVLYWRFPNGKVLPFFSPFASYAENRRLRAGLRLHREAWGFKKGEGEIVSHLHGQFVPWPPKDGQP